MTVYEDAAVTKYGNTVKIKYKDGVRPKTVIKMQWLKNSHEDAVKNN